LSCLLCEKLLESVVFCGWFIKVAFFVRQISNLRIAFILRRSEQDRLQELLQPALQPGFADDGATVAAPAVAAARAAK
jgi:hypothetical protein